MLNVWRKIGEPIYIGSNITITPVAAGDGKVCLRVECPRDVPVYRAEALPIHAPTPPPPPEATDGTH